MSIIISPLISSFHVFCPSWNVLTFCTTDGTPEIPSELDVNHVDFKCNCLTKYNKLCKNSILCFKHSVEEKTKIKRFHPDIGNVIKIYKVVQEQHALELKKTYKLDKKAEKELKKQLNHLNKVTKKNRESTSLKKKNKRIKKPEQLGILHQPNVIDLKFVSMLTEKLSSLPDDMDERMNGFNHRINLNNLILTQAFTQEFQNL